MSEKRLEGEWEKLRAMWIGGDAPDDLVQDMRAAFFAGAQAMITLMTVGLGPGEEPTQADADFVAGLNAELQEFIDDFQIKNLPAEGRA